MTIQELLKEAQLTSISDEEIKKLRNLLIQVGIENDEQERRNYSSEVFNRTYNI